MDNDLSLLDKYTRTEDMIDNEHLWNDIQKQTLDSYRDILKQEKGFGSDDDIIDKRNAFESDNTSWSDLTDIDKAAVAHLDNLRPEINIHELGVSHERNELNIKTSEVDIRGLDNIANDNELLQEQASDATFSPFDLSLNDSIKHTTDSEFSNIDRYGAPIPPSVQSTPLPEIIPLQDVM